MVNAAGPGTGQRAKPWPQLAALTFGIVYTLVGIVGFFITGFDNFFGHTGEKLLIFQINPFHNVVHLVIGLAGIALSRSLAGARTYGWLLAVGYGAAFVYGLFAIDQSWDFLHLNWADNILHVVTALAGLAIALGPVKQVATERGPNVDFGRRER